MARPTIILTMLLLLLASVSASTNYTSNWTGDANGTTIIGTLQANLTLSPINWTEQNQTTGNATGIINVKLNNTGNNTLVQPFCVGYTIVSIYSNDTCTPIPGTVLTPLLNAGTTSNGCSGSQNYSSCYEELIRSHYASGNVTRIVNGKLIIPWMTSSTSCTASQLHAGTFANGYPFVTDEFSQIGVLLALGMNQTKFIQYKNTVNVINSSRGQIPGWEPFMNESNGLIEACKSGYNGNCDTASDATTRIIISLFTASNNTAFTNTTDNTNSYQLAVNLSQDFVKYEVVNQCYNSTLGNGQICWWMAGGSVVKSTGLGATNFAYSGYFGDGIIAMLAACAGTGNQTYCAIAANISMNYLQAAKFDGNTFTVSPGLAFQWTNLTGTPVATCTNTCSPDQWDGADAPRAVGVCLALQYANAMSVNLPNMTRYCQLWEQRYMRQLNSYPYQYYSNGTQSVSNQSGYLAQGWQAQALAGANTTNFETVMRNCLNHYSSGTGTYDSTSCDGIYNEAFCERALGIGLGRDLPAFTNPGIACIVPAPVTYTNGGLGITLNLPGNNTNVTSNYAILNFTVTNNNVSTTGATNGTLPQVVYSTSFTTDPTVDGWTLNSWTWNNVSLLLNNSAESGGSAHTPSMNKSLYNNGFLENFNSQVGNSTNCKAYFGTDSITDSGDRILLCDRIGDGSGNSINLKHDGGNFSSITCSKVNCNVTMIINQTAGWVNVSNGSTSWKEGIVNSHTYGNTTSFAPGTNMTGGWNITDYTFTNLGTAFTTGGTQGNSSLNVTITNSTGQLYQRNITGNNTIVTYNWTGLSNGVYAYVINLKSYGGENRNFSLSLNISQPTLGVTTNYCTLTGTVTITGIPNATAINLSITNTTDGTSYWTPDQINYQLKNLGTTTSNKTLLLSTYPQTQNNTYQGKLIFTNTSSGSFIPVITYGPNSSQNNTAVDVSCDGTNYLANVTSGISNACPVVGNLLTYRITLYRNTTSSPTLVSLTINTTDTPVCGNSIQETGEACDLGNSANGACPSTCSASCQTNSCNNGGGGGGGTIVNNPPPVFNNTETNANTSLLDTKTSIITNDNIIKVIAASLAIFIILSIATVVVRR